MDACQEGVIYCWLVAAAVSYNLTMRHPRWVGIKRWEPLEYSLCLSAGGVFKHTAFLLAFWPSAHFVCWGKKKISVCSVLRYHHLLTWSSGYTEGEALHRACRPHTLFSRPHSQQIKSKPTCTRIVKNFHTQQTRTNTLPFSQTCDPQVLSELAEAHSYTSMPHYTRPVFLNADSFLQWTVALTVSAYFSFIATLIIPRCSQTWSTKTYHKQAIPCFIRKHKRTMCWLA